MKESEIYELGLHGVFMTAESKPSDSLFTTVMRVPGGWIYRSFDKGSGIMSSVFVPFNNEFQSSSQTFEKPTPHQISEDT